MKKFNLKRVCGLLSLLLMMPLWICAQNITVKGNVSDPTGDPLPGVNVVQAGQSKGVVTNIDGDYVIAVPSNASLTFTYVGFEPQTVAVNGRTTVNVTLAEDKKVLDDVVVIGYGTMKRRDITGSVVSVDKEAMMKKVPTNIGQALQGAAAGVIVTQQDGAPDANAAIRVRGIGTINGSADPLYVVDGVQVGTNANFVNPSDIESIEVLKDASATAIYGAAGANGVIMITTKHGSAGSMVVNVTADFGISNLPYKLKTLDIDTFAKSVREAKSNAGAGLYNVVWDAQYDGHRNYIDWQDQMTHTAFRQQYGISVSGGNEKATYNFSVGYLDNDGIVVNTNMKRLTARANNVTKVNKWLELGIDMNMVHSESRGSNAAFNNNGNLSSLRDFAYMTPSLDYVEGNVLGGKIINVLPVNRDGSFGTGYLNTADGWEGNTSNAANPYATQMESNGVSKSNRVFASAYAQITFCKGLTLKSIGSYSSYSGEGNNFSGGRKRYNMIDGKLTEIDVTNGNKIDNRYDFSLNNNSSYALGIETYLTYHFQNDIHDLTVMLGNSVSKSWGQWLSGGAKDFFSADNRNIGLTNDISTKTVSGAFNADVRGISYFGRASYALMDRYILTATVRRDGSSNFGSGNRWGTFPSAAAAWRFSEEKFMQGLGLSNGKLRFGWGQTGNAGNMTGKAIAALSTWETRYNFYNQGGTLGAFGGNRQMVSGFYAGLVDTNLKWETNEQMNFGLDLGFLNGSLNVNLDYFIRRSKDLLLNQQIRPSTGFSEVYTNYGEIENQGLEFSITYNKAINKDWTINVGINGSTLKNKVKKMGDPLYSTNTGTTNDGSNVGAVGDPAGFHWGNHSVCMEGEAVGSFYGYETAGIIMNEQQLKEYLDRVQLSEGEAHVGDFMYVDQPTWHEENGEMVYSPDGILDQNDMKVLGNGIPKFNYGITLGATYKNWDFNMYMYGVLGQKILSYSAMRLSTVFSSDDQTFPNILQESWEQVAHVSNGQVTNSNATLPRLMMVDTALNMRCSDAWVKNGDFLRMSTVQIGYTLDQDFIKKLGLNRIRLYASVQNLFTLSKYNKYGDPEVGQGSVLFSGLDTGRFPMPRTWQFGLNVTF